MPVMTTPEGQPAPDPDPWSWRPPRRAARPALLLVVSMMLLTSSRAVALIEPAPPVRDYVFFWLSATMLVLTIVLLVVQVVRSRVRLTSAGVEVRQIRTRLHPYDDITAVRRNPWFGGAITVLTRDGRTHALPAPVRGKDGAEEPVVAAAFAEIRRRSGEDPERTPPR